VSTAAGAGKPSRVRCARERPRSARDGVLRHAARLFWARSYSAAYVGGLAMQARIKHSALDYHSAYWQKQLEQEARAGEVRAQTRLGLAHMYMLGALNWSSEWLDPRRKSPEQLAATLCEFRFNGVGNLGEGPLQ
jgi:Tetracyclin repressor-like, C-terminal domain